MYTVYNHREGFSKFHRRVVINMEHYLIARHCLPGTEINIVPAGPLKHLEIYLLLVRSAVTRVRGKT